MLIEFKVKNFMSIKDEVVLSMEANSKDDLKDNLVVIEKEKLLKSACVFGANAAGKSNIIKALTSSIIFIRNSNMIQTGQKLLGMVPFKFDDTAINEPSFFEYTFITNDTKYVYGFSADVDKVYEEYLYKYSSAKASLIFNRKNTNDYKFPQITKTKLNEIKEKNTDNKLFLSTANMWNFNEVKEPFDWFMTNINTYSEFHLGAVDINKYNNSVVKEKVLKILNNSDICIKDYDIKVVNRKPNDDEKRTITFFNSMVGNPLHRQENVSEIRITTKHEIIDLNGNKKEYTLDMSEESIGTQKMFYIGLILQDILSGQTMIVDELENSLHSFLVKYLIKMFHDPKVNNNNAQLIFTTHSNSLLDLDIFRREQINFVEKDEKTNATTIFSLSDYPVRKNEDIEKGYANGRFGAVPFIEENL